VQNAREQDVTLALPVMGEERGRASTKYGRAQRTRIPVGISVREKPMRIRLQRFSYRFAEQVLNSRLAIKQELEEILLDPGINLSELSRPGFNSVLDKLFAAKGWETQPPVFEEPGIF
jgi:hypothetical protein